MSITPLKPKDNLALAAARLSKAAPNAWGDLVAAFSVYARERELACVQAPADKVLLAQGMARQCNELLTLITDEAAKVKQGA